MNIGDTTLTAEQVRDAEEFPPAVNAYAAGYQLGRLHSIMKVADIGIWVSPGPFSIGYRHGWNVDGRPV